MLVSLLLILCSCILLVFVVVVDLTVPPATGAHKSSSSVAGAMSDMVPKDKLMGLVSSAQVCVSVVLVFQTVSLLRGGLLTTPVA